MNELLEIQKIIIPQAIELMERRYSILRQISLNQPIGRRTLSNKLGLSERTIRSETEFLKEQGLIKVEVSGMTITDSGNITLRKLAGIMDNITGLTSIQEKLKSILNIKNAVVTYGNLNLDEMNAKDLSKSATEYLLKVLKDDSIVAITGGTTMKSFAKTMDTNKEYANVKVVPARGSLGKKLDIQSNAVATDLAKNLKAETEVLNLPDELATTARDALMGIPSIKNTLDIIKKANILIFSIGRADIMAKRRGFSEEDVQLLLNKGAVGEAFGYYFNENGEIVHKLNTVGMDLDQYKKMEESILVLSDVNKIDALLSILSVNKNITLVTTQQCAEKLLSKFK